PENGSSGANSRGKGIVSFRQSSTTAHRNDPLPCWGASSARDTPKAARTVSAPDAIRRVHRSRTVAFIFVLRQAILDRLRYEGAVAPRPRSERTIHDEEAQARNEQSGS